MVSPLFTLYEVPFITTKNGPVPALAVNVTKAVPDPQYEELDEIEPCGNPHSDEYEVVVAE